MKAERRHELKSNDLAWSMENLPLLLQLHANKILLVVIAVALVVILMRYRSNAEANRIELVNQEMATIRAAMNGLQTADMSLDQDVVAITRVQRADEISRGIESVLADADEKQQNILAEATLARGDLYWHLANAPELPGATTRPTLKLPQSSDEYLKKAEDSYRSVVERYGSEASPSTAALFGLAAVAENRRDWAAAKTRYDQILDAKTAGNAFKEQARMRIELLKVIEKPMFVGPLHPTTGPSSAPATGAMMGPMMPLTMSSTTARASTTRSTVSATLPATTQSAR